MGYTVHVLIIIVCWYCWELLDSIMYIEIIVCLLGMDSTCTCTSFSNNVHEHVPLKYFMFKECLHQ